MTARLPIYWITYSLLVLNLLTPWAGHAERQESDVFNSSGPYDRYAVGGAHRWYDNHSTETKQKSSHCLSILDEAKTFQGNALALYEEARRPENGKQQSALVKQANDQIRLRQEKLRAFTDCVNQAGRQTGLASDTFASSGDGNHTVEIPTQPTPQPSPVPDMRGEKGLKRVPDSSSQPEDTPTPVTFDKAVDNCFKNSDPNYRSSDWSGFNQESLRPKSVGQFQQSFNVSGIGAEQALRLDELAYGKWNDRELMHDYLIGWLTHCLSRTKVLPLQDPRGPYKRYLRSPSQSSSKNPTRLAEREDKFFHGYQSYPLPPFWNRKSAAPPSPER